MDLLHFMLGLRLWDTYTTGMNKRRGSCQQLTANISSRIWAAIKREALLTAADGAATPQEIDAIFKDVLQTKKGPFELMDTVGLDVVLDIENHYASVRMGIPEEPREYLRKMLEMGHLGVKAGRGFYSYEQAPIPTE